jgi:Ran GTPase-activating protein (RanGAP) involved in mRNA processing and transport
MITETIAETKPAAIYAELSAAGGRRISYSRQSQRNNGAMRRFRQKYKSPRKDVGATDHWQDVCAEIAESCQVAGRIKALMTSVKASATLKVLDLSGTNLGDTGARMVGSGIAANITLDTLSLCLNGLGTRGIRILASSLASNKKLTSLDLGFNRNIADEGAREMASALSRNSTITSLGFGHSGIGDKGVQELADSILSVETFDQSDYSSYAPTSVEPASGMMCSLSYLDLQGNLIGESGAEALADALRFNKVLRALDIGYNSIGDAGATAMASALRENQTLVRLSVRENSIQAKGIRSLMGSFESNSTLKTLDSSFNVFKNSQHMYEAAQIRNVSLVELSLQNCCIFDDGMMDVLNYTKNLESLDLSYNSLGSEACETLAGELGKNLKLKVLNLHANQIADNGAFQISKALRTNSTLMSLSLGANGIGSKGAWVLLASLENNSALATLDLSFNEIADDGAVLIAGILQNEFFSTSVNLQYNHLSEVGSQLLSTSTGEVYGGSCDVCVQIHN